MKRFYILLLVIFSLVNAYQSDAAQSQPIGGQSLDLNDSSNAVEWNARWIQHPMFRNLSFRYQYRKDKETDVSGIDEKDPKNIHTLFRKVFELNGQKIKSAKLFITADDVYKLYLNEEFIGLGPAPGYLFAYPYNAWDVTKALQSGKLNCIAVHVYYQGLVNRVWGSGDNLQGLLAQLEITFQNGQTETIITDGSWKYHQTNAYDSDRTMGYKTQFAEDIDLHQIIPDWKTVSFDDGDWQNPFVRGNPTPGQYTLAPQITPPLAYEKVWPEKIIKTGEGRYFIDFGTELTGTTCFQVTGSDGHKVEIRHGEELTKENEVRFEMRASCKYQEFITLAGRPNDLIEFFDYKGFRYVEVLNWPEELTKDNVWILNRHYPFPQEACLFTSSNNILNRIWQLCENGAKQGTQDTYLDCPTREKGGYLGDAYVTGQAHLYLTGDALVLKKTLQDFAYSARLCPGLMAVAPGNFMQEIADYSLLWPIIVERYYLWSGDEQFVKSMIPILDGMLEWFAQYENEDGLLEAVPEKWNLVDWPKNLRDNYDFDDQKIAGINTVLNHFYYGCLQSSIRLYQYAENSKKAFAANNTAVKLKQSMQDQLMNPTAGLFVDAAGSSHSALHSNALSPMFGVAPKGGTDRLIEFLRKKRMVCGVYFASFLLEGLYNAAEPDLAYDLITCKDIHSWNTMLEAGATTCMEAWGPEQKWNTSWCHPWSSCPIFIVAGELMGLKPGKPGWEEINFSPKPPKDLESAELTITTPKGAITTSFQQTDDEIVYQLLVPQGSAAKVTLLNVKRIIVDGKKVEAKQRQASDSVIYNELPMRLQPGQHTLKVYR